MKLIILFISTIILAGCEIRPAPVLSIGSPYDSATFEQALRRIDSLKRVDSVTVWR